MPKPGIRESKPEQGCEPSVVVFDELSQRLASAYSQLEQRVAALSAELAEARRERQRERQQKQHLADQLGVLLETLPAAVVLVDARDRVDRFNPAAERLFPRLAWGRRWAEIFAESVAGEPAPGDWALQDGRHVSMSQQPLNDRGRVLVIIDVTEQRRLQAHAERQDRLAAMGQMAAQLAHQVRTPLSTCLLYAGQLNRRALDEEMRGRFSSKLLEGLRHTENLVREMLAFSRGDCFSLAPTRVGDLLETAVAALRPRVARLGARLWVEAGDAAGVVFAGNRDALAGALCNLVDNALDHGGEGVQVSVSAILADDASLLLAVDDGGPGVPPGVRERIFDPFFTTRERGTGLGLAVVQAVVLRHGGSLRLAESALGGACFELQLPLLPAAEAAVPDEKEHAA
jgi:two-component system sensor histidine kinase FlrB